MGTAAAAVWLRAGRGEQRKSHVIFEILPITLTTPSAHVNVYVLQIFSSFSVGFRSRYSHCKTSTASIRTYIYEMIDDLYFVLGV